MCTGGGWISALKWNQASGGRLPGWGTGPPPRACPPASPCTWPGVQPHRLNRNPRDRCLPSAYTASLAPACGILVRILSRWVCPPPSSAGSLTWERLGGTFPSAGWGESPRMQPQVCRPPPARLSLGRRPRPLGRCRNKDVGFSGDFCCFVFFSNERKNQQ